MPFANTNDGQEIYYEVHGTTGPLLIFISGYFGISDLWKPLITSLGPGHRCLTFDARGYGHSSKPTDPKSYSVLRSSQDLDTVIKAAGLHTEPAVLVTHSMGGNIASAYYLSHPRPQNISGIIYTGTYYDGPTIAKFIPRETLHAEADSPQKCIEFYTRMGLAESIAREAAKWPAYARKNTADALYDFEMEGRYSNITIPTVIIQGEEDFAGPVHGAVRPMLAELPNCVLRCLPRVGHFPGTEAVGDVAGVVEEFVRGLE
ncbi:putative alpha/beta fold family hydrolase [Aspergillus carlsbadensis]|nr:putative alpha/beta fold family hydrolase [Aspergillus carlsbadensis]